MSPRGAETLLYTSTLSERSADGDYGSDWPTAECILDGKWRSLWRLSCEKFNTRKSLLAADQKINTVGRLLIEFLLLSELRHNPPNLLPDMIFNLYFILDTSQFCFSLNVALDKLRINNCKIEFKIYKKMQINEIKKKKKLIMKSTKSI